MFFPARTENGRILYSKDKPADVCRQVLTAQHDRFIVRATSLTCEKCGNSIRNGDIKCWACPNPMSSVNDSFTVNLANTGIKAHGVFSGFLSVWNPGQLTCKVQQYGYGSRLEIKLSGTLSLAEMLITVVICALLCCGTMSLFFPHDMFHTAVALVFFPLGPVLYLYHRRQQERDLLLFVSNRLPELLPNGFAEQPDRSQ